MSMLARWSDRLHSLALQTLDDLLRLGEQRVRITIFKKVLRETISSQIKSGQIKSVEDLQLWLSSAEVAVASLKNEPFEFY